MERVFIVHPNNKIVLHIYFILAFRSYHWNARWHSKTACFRFVSKNEDLRVCYQSWQVISKYLLTSCSSSSGNSGKKIDFAPMWGLKKSAGPKTKWKERSEGQSPGFPPKPPTGKGRPLGKKKQHSRCHRELRLPKAWWPPHKPRGVRKGWGANAHACFQAPNTIWQQKSESESKMSVCEQRA